MEFNQSLNHNTCIAAPTVLKVSRIKEHVGSHQMNYE